MKTDASLTRRGFLARTTLTAAGAALGGLAGNPLAAAPFAPPVVVFSKIYHQIKLTLEDSAALTAEAGLDGVDCPVRAKDQILPERVKDDLPRYVELLRQRGCQLPLLTTAIVNPASSHAESILSTARKLGIRYYRAGYFQASKGQTTAQVTAEAKAQLQELAALNREHGVCALMQNHSPGRPNGPLGGDLNDLLELVRDFDPAQIGVAFDLGHALLVHGDDWPTHFERLKSHIKIAYIKDVKRGKGFVRFGTGEFAGTDFFKRLKAMNYTAPLSLHIEYEWTPPGESANRAALSRALKESLAALKGWLAAA